MHQWQESKDADNTEGQYVLYLVLIKMCVFDMFVALTSKGQMQSLDVVQHVTVTCYSTVHDI